MPSLSPDRRHRKRLATRQKISDVATALFIQRGFDNVTVDEIAAAADVARMTVFNHFARKEDMFFDLNDEAREDLLMALQSKPAGTSPIEVLRLFAHAAITRKRPYVRFAEAGTHRFLATIQASSALQARARAIREELTELLATALATAAGHHTPDLDARLAASLLVATWVVASMEAHRVFGLTQDVAQADAAFLAAIDKGANGAAAAVAGTPYARSGTL